MLGHYFHFFKILKIKCNANCKNKISIQFDLFDDWHFIARKFCPTFKGSPHNGQGESCPWEFWNVTLKNHWNLWMVDSVLPTKIFDSKWVHTSWRWARFLKGQVWPLADTLYQQHTHKTSLYLSLSLSLSLSFLILSLFFPSFFLLCPISLYLPFQFYIISFSL